MAQDQSSTGEVVETPGGWVFPVLLAMLLVVGAWWVAGGREMSSQTSDAPASAEWSPAPLPQGQTVSLEIDFGNGATKRFSALNWHEGMTVADLMHAASEFRPGIRYSHLGEGASGFLTSIDGFKGEGAGGRNWHYRVDNRHAETSFSLQEIDEQAHVLWKFESGD